MEEKEGISLGEIFKLMFSEKWVLLIIAVVVTVLGTLAMQLYSGLSTEYVVDFKLKMPGYSMSDTYYYPDGEPFYYSTLVTENTLEAVKATNSLFEDVNTEALASRGGISIKFELPDADYVEFIDGTYILTASARYFADSDVAKEFLRAVANYPCTYLSTMNMKHDSNLVLYDKADEYLQQIDYLQAQMDEIRLSLSTLISSYGANLVVEEGRTLNSYLRDVNAYANSYEYSNLKQEYTGAISVNDEGEIVSWSSDHVFYLLKEESINNYKNQQNELKKEFDNENFILEKMRVSTDTQSNIVAIQEQARRVTEIRDKKAVVDAILMAVEEGRCKVDTDGAFKTRIEGVKSKLDEFTDMLERIEPIVYGKTSNANFMQSNIISVNGSIGIVKSVIISLVIAIVLAAIVSFVVGYNKHKKLTNGEKSVEGANAAPLFSHIAAEAAPAEQSPDATEEKK